MIADAIILILTEAEAQPAHLKSVGVPISSLDIFPFFPLLFFLSPLRVPVGGMLETGKGGAKETEAKQLTEEISHETTRNLSR